jgi:D-alanyl-D-alanine dipeptidase
VEELRAEALAAQPPTQSDDLLEPDLVELQDLDSTIRYDIRYATSNNFMRAVFYDEPRAVMQRPAAEALVRAHRALADWGFGLLIHDAYRPWHVTKMFWDATPESQKLFVANPADGSRHNRGAAVDLTLFDLSTGDPVEMVGGYDEFSERSFPDYPGGTSLQRWHRGLLRSAMESVGFDVYEWEWWHFDYGDWNRYPVLNLRFDEVG